jgi:EAL domain-containing protein (putative c-di-GMP-specific phosphodiesterase class I)
MELLTLTMYAPPRTVPVPRSNRLSDAPQAMPAAGPRRASQTALERLVSPVDLTVVFQPIVNMTDGELFAHEALVRCSVPALKNPLVLFERALEVGCAGRLGRMIREIAVPLSSGRPLFLNVHPQELHEAWIVRPDDPIFGHDHVLYVEVTEAMPLTQYELCMSVLRELRSRCNVELVVDDLGAGYSNLKRILDFQPKIVKLDRQLIIDIDRNQRQQKLVAGIVRMCVDLDAMVVAEGIETDQEFIVLQDIGVHYGQGYLFAKPAFPMPAITWPPDSHVQTKPGLKRASSYPPPAA